MIEQLSFVVNLVQHSENIVFLFYAAVLDLGDMKKYFYISWPSLRCMKLMYILLVCLLTYWLSKIRMVHNMQ